MKKILHFFRIEKFTEEFVELMNENSNFEHTFWTYGDDRIYVQCKSNYLKKKNVKYFPRIDIKMNKTSTEKQLQEYDLIVFHGVFENVIVEFFSRHKSLLKKLALYFWGGDKKICGNWKENLQRWYVVRNAGIIITIIPQDFLDIKRKYHPIGKHFCARYFNSIGLDLNKKQKLTKKERGSINIQIGNSATETNNHIEVLDRLSQYKEKDIKIYLPLSYGNKEYADFVIKYGRKIFKNKLVPITNFMPLNEYYLFLCEMDIAIFNMTRQQALGNICLLMQNGSKLFFRPEGLLWDFFASELNCEISRTDEIGKIKFEQFIEFSVKQKEINRKKINEYFSKENSIKEWENIFLFQ